MFWLRWILYSSPLWLGFGGAWLYQSVASLQLEREAGSIVVAIERPVGGLGPFVPHDGVEGEIAGLLFEPLLRRDGNLQLRPNLLERWSTRQVVTLRCASEEAAGEAEARILAGETLPAGIAPLAVDRSGAVLALAFEGRGDEAERALLEGLPPDLLGDDLLVTVRAEHSVASLLEAWLATATERAQLRLMERRGEGEADLYLRGETEGFLKELRLYLDSNPATSPTLEVAGRRSHSSSRELLLELRPDALWHDGRPFTAEDVLFSYRLFTRPDSPLPLAAAFDHLASLEATGPHRLRAVLRDAPGTMLESWERLPLLPAHRFADKGDLAAALGAFLLEPVGLGPYRLERRRGDGGVELAAHAACHRGAPAEKRVRYRRFPSLESVLLALRSGELDAIEPDARFLDWSRRHPEAVESLRDLPRFQHLVVWNLDRAPFDRSGVRNALARAYDPGAALRDTATEFQVPSKGLFLPGAPHVAEPMLLPLYDPRGAANLLEREGFPLDEISGLRRDGEGKPLSFALLVNAGHEEHRRLAEALAEQWAALGVEARVEAAPWPEILSRRLPQREFDAVLVSWALPLGRDLRAVWHGDSAGPGGGNLAGLRDAEVDKLVESLHRESDPALLAETTAALQRAIATLQPCLFLGDSGRIVTVRSGALEVRRPGETAPLPLGGAMGKAGLAEERPWWTKIKAP
jgi:peptide/nickel transport system substrate-binding protein